MGPPNLANEALTAFTFQVTTSAPEGSFCTMKRWLNTQIGYLLAMVNSDVLFRNGQNNFIENVHMCNALCVGSAIWAPRKLCNRERLVL